jgi:CDP-diacylglycerol--glycerol-3-phosphate 3-phosphatidyltransferase
MFPRSWLARARRLAEGAVRPLAHLGLTPNMVTVVGFVLNIMTAVVLATGHLSIGGAMLFFAGTFDMLDGALARVTGEQSDFGAFLDSLLDRYSEAAILLALIFQFVIRHDTLAVLLVYLVAVGSILISYARARAESIGVECKVGIAPRPERVIILGLGLLFKENTTIAALLVLAFLTHATAMQRLFHVWQETHKQANPTQSAPKDRKPKAEAREGSTT